MKKGIRQILTAVIVGVMAVLIPNLFSANGVSAQPPPPWECLPNVDGVVVDIVVWSSQADRDTVCNTFTNAVNGSATFKERVIAGGQAHNNFLTINVYRNTKLFIGGALGGMFKIDLADIEGIRDVKYFPGAAGAQVNTIADGFLVETLAHETEHTTGSIDPANCGPDKGPAVVTENSVLGELAKGFTRENYCWFDDKGTPDCGDDEGGIYFKVGGNAVTFEAVKSGFQEIYSYWGIPDQPAVCAPDGAVGGVAELPEIAELEAATSEKAATNYIPLAGIAATVAIVLTTLLIVVWYTRRRQSS